MSFVKTVLSGLILMCSISLVACKSIDKEVAPGEIQRTQATTGVYAEIFVDPNDADLSSVDVSASGADTAFINAHFDGKVIEKLFLSKGESNWIFIFEGGDVAPEDITVNYVKKDGSGMVKQKYSLVLEED